MKYNNSKILVIGDLSKVLTDYWQGGNLPFEHWESSAKIIERLSGSYFDTISIILTGSSKIKKTLGLLRSYHPKPRIILISPIHFEPVALRFVKAELADDYLICPVDIASLYNKLAMNIVYEVPEPMCCLDSQKVKMLEKLATEDELTGLKNRRYLWEFARQVIDIARKENTQVTLLVFDIDDFKHYNDVYSHTIGDRILKQAAVLIKRSCRSHDIVARIGGDEFAVVFWSLPVDLRKPENERRIVNDHPQEVLFIAKRFIKELEIAELPFLGKRGKGTLTISGGLATFPRDGQSVVELFQLADEALLDAKSSGKNKIYLVDSGNDVNSIT